MLHSAQGYEPSSSTTARSRAACRYDAEPYQTGPGLVSALLAALASVGEQQAKAGEQLPLVPT
ncbi:MAG: hypothetical protein KAX55_02410 [Propionivibrio sp.]|nr:hypothetical protein [Propionivibrio sp.]